GTDARPTFGSPFPQTTGVALAQWSQTGPQAAAKSPTRRVVVYPKFNNPRSHGCQTRRLLRNFRSSLSRGEKIRHASSVCFPNRRPGIAITSQPGAARRPATTNEMPRNVAAANIQRDEQPRRHGRPEARAKGVDSSRYNDMDQAIHAN